MYIVLEGVQASSFTLESLHIYVLVHTDISIALITNKFSIHQEQQKALRTAMQQQQQQASPAAPSPR